MTNLNREAWLTELAQRLEREVFADFSLSSYRLTCGFPSKNAFARKAQRLGECHSSVNSSGGVHEIFISPVLGESLQVAGVVSHELAHVAAGVGAGHGKDFVRVCRHVGLTAGRATSAQPGPQLNERLRSLLANFGPYPHHAMRVQDRQATRQSGSVVLECECGCRVTIQRKWLDEVGPPTCACGEVFSAKS